MLPADRQTVLTGYPSIDKPWRKYYSKEEKTLKIPEGTMWDYLYERNKDYPEDIAIEYYGRRITYRELFRQIDQCSRNLTAIGIGKNDIVTVQSIALPQIVVIVYALTRIGACGNMLLPDAKVEEIVSSMNKTHSKLLIAVDKLFENYEEDLPETFDKTIILLNVGDQMGLFPRMLTKRKTAYTQRNKKVHTLSWRSFLKGVGDNYDENHDSDCPAFMVRTRGTTGIPKEVVLTSRGFNSVAEGVFFSDMCSGWKRQDVNVLLLPPFIAFGIGSGIHHSLSYGMRTRIVLDVSPSAMSSVLMEYKPNYIMAGTVQVEQMISDLREKNIDLSYIKLISVGGERMSLDYEEKVCDFLKQHQCCVLPLKGYGLTETAGGVVAETLRTQKSGSVGIPFANCNIKIVDTETEEELTYNKQGEICLASPGIMQEYYENPEATNDIIETIDNVRWLHTGDIGEISEDGILTITGRIKRIIICKEGTVYHKVFPVVLEDQLSKQLGVKEIAIVGKSNPETGNVLIAYVVPENGSKFDQVKGELKKYSNQNLEIYERPAEYVYIEKLPRTLIGKVDFRSLEKLASNE